MCSRLKFDKQFSFCIPSTTATITNHKGKSLVAIWDKEKPHARIETLQNKSSYWNGYTLGKLKAVSFFEKGKEIQIPSDKNILVTISPDKKNFSIVTREATSVEKYLIGHNRVPVYV